YLRIFSGTGEESSNSGGLQDRNGVVVQQFVIRHECELVMQCLTDEHAIEGVTVVRWQRQKMRHRLHLQREDCNSMRSPKIVDVFVCRIREGKLSNLMLDQGFPDRDHAQIRLVGFIADGVERVLGKLGIVGDVPQERVRIEQQLHRPSKASSNSSGSGSSKSSGTTN